MSSSSLARRRMFVGVTVAVTTDGGDYRLLATRSPGYRLHQGATRVRGLGQRPPRPPSNLDRRSIADRHFEMPGCVAPGPIRTGMITGNKSTQCPELRCYAAFSKPMLPKTSFARRLLDTTLGATHVCGSLGVNSASQPVASHYSTSCFPATSACDARQLTAQSGLPAQQA